MPRGVVILAALLAAGWAAPTAAQDPDTLQNAGTPAGADARPAPQDTAPGEALAPEPAYAPPRFALSLTVGTLGSGTLQSQPVTATRINSAGEALDSTLLTRSVEAEGGFQLGASGVLSLGHAWAVRLGVGVGRTTLAPVYDGEDDLFTSTAARLAATEATDATVLALEAALRMRIPSTRRAQPYLELGASTVRWQTERDLAGSPQSSDGIQRIAGLAAAGVDVPFSDRLAARLQATTRVFRTPVDAAPAGGVAAASPTLIVIYAGPGPDPYADGVRELTTTLSLELGITLGLGGTVEPPAPPAAPAASPSPPGR